MNYIKQFLAFWYDFIVGDDWVVAAGVVVLLAAAGALARAEMNNLSPWHLQTSKADLSALGSNPVDFVDARTVHSAKWEKGIETGCK